MRIAIDLFILKHQFKRELQLPCRESSVEHTKSPAIGVGVADSRKVGLIEQVECLGAKLQETRFSDREALVDTEIGLVTKRSLHVVARGIAERLPIVGHA